jgi:hypothetical protein
MAFRDFRPEFSKKCKFFSEANQKRLTKLNAAIHVMPVIDHGDRPIPNKFVLFMDTPATRELKTRRTGNGGRLL